VFENFLFFYVRAFCVLVLEIGLCHSGVRIVLGL